MIVGLIDWQLGSYQDLNQNLFLKRERLYRCEDENPEHERWQLDTFDTD